MSVAIFYCYTELCEDACLFFVACRDISRVIQTTCSYMYCNKYVTSVYVYRKRTFTVRTVLLDFTYLNY